MRVKKEGKDLKKTEWMYKVVHSFHYILPYLRRSACLCDNHAPHELSRTHFSAAVQQFFQLELTCPFLRYLQHTRRVLCPHLKYLHHTLRALCPQVQYLKHTLTVSCHDVRLVQSSIIVQKDIIE